MNFKDGPFVLSCAFTVIYNDETVLRSLQQYLTIKYFNEAFKALEILTDRSKAAVLFRLLSVRQRVCYRRCAITFGRLSLSLLSISWVCCAL